MNNLQSSMSKQGPIVFQFPWIFLIVYEDGALISWHGCRSESVMEVT